MAGVARPMLRYERENGIRFLMGLAGGMVVAAAILALMAYAVGTALHTAVGLQPRLVAAAAVCGALGLADVVNRTPHLWRQVPQALIRVLPSGTLGFVWGFDIGLLFTTQRVVSLAWAAIAGVCFVEPRSAAVVVGVMAILTTGTIGISSLPRGFVLERYGSQRERIWRRYIRIGSGVTLAAVAAQLALQAFQM